MADVLMTLRKKATTIAVVLGLLAVLFLGYGWAKGKFSKREIGLGVAGSILASAIVIMTIGPVEQEELIARLSKFSARSRVAGVLGEVLEQLERNEVFIRYHKTSIALQKNSGEHMIIGELNSEYIAENLTDRTIDYALKCQLAAMEEILRAHPIEWLLFEVRKRKKTGVAWVSVEVATPSRGEADVSRNIRIGPDEHVQVRWAYRRAFWKTGNIIVQPLNPCDGLEFHFAHPPEIIAELYSLDPRGSEKTTIKEFGDKAILSMDGVLQSGWGAQAEWRPKPC